MWGGSQHIYFFPFGYSINLDCIFTTILQGHLSHKWTNCIVGVCTWSLYWTDFSILLGYIYPLQQYHTISMDLGIWQCKSFNCVCLYYVLKKWSPHHFPGQIPCLYRIKSKLFTRAYNAIHVLTTAYFSDFISCVYLNLPSTSPPPFALYAAASLAILQTLAVFARMLFPQTPSSLYGLFLHKYQSQDRNLLSSLPTELPSLTQIMLVI